jgi:hypothetical protein
MRWWRWAAGLLLVAAAIAFACGKGMDDPGTDSGSPDGGTGQVGQGNDAGTQDGGSNYDAGTQDGGSGYDAGTQDGGNTDGGMTDGGTADGGVAWTPPPPIDFPTTVNWTFYGPQNGGPHDVYQVTSDGDGNVWVAGGEDGLFLLRPGATKFERFTMADGLRPYGYMPDGSDPVGPKYLKAIAVTGGDGSSVYVGYQGLGIDKTSAGQCESAWDNTTKAQQLARAYIYKSGDADRVTLTASGLKVVHYDIFSGPGVVAGEPGGREKLCTIYRIVYDKAHGDLWFGGNHGFAWGEPNYGGNPKCDGQLNCSGVVEHAHPAFNGADANGGCCDYITQDYRGVALDPSSGDVWFGGENRTTKFHWGATAGSKQSRFFAAESWTEDNGGVWPPPSCPAPPCFGANRIDIWPDAAGEVAFVGGSWVPHYPTPAERQPEDLVFGIAALGDGGAYVGSGYLGLKRLDSFGNVVSDETSRLFDKAVGAVARDPIDGKVWVGNRYGGGLHRLSGSSTDHFANDTFGAVLANMGIEDVQFAVSGGARKVLVGFRSNSKIAGFVAVYSGN